MKPDLELAGWISLIVMGVVATLKQAYPALKGGRTIVIAGAASCIVALLAQIGYVGMRHLQDFAQAGLNASIAWPASLGFSWLVRMPKRPGNGGPTPGA